MKRTSFALLIVLAACETEEPIKQSPNQQTKLDYVIYSYDLEDIGFEPSYKVTYEYEPDGKLNKYTSLSYNAEAESYNEERYFDFQHSDGKLTSIKGYLLDADAPYLTYSYQYQGEIVSKIIETNSGSGLNSEANFSYIGNDSVRVSYSYSNGNSFQYAFRYDQNKNITIDKTTKGAQLCSKGIYAYDSKINPFSTLGYVDYYLTNMSANNKLAESVEFVACTFPEFVPESHTYQYNEEGLPTEAITYYKSETGAKMKREFFYKKI